jgi:hypothetical protein
MEEDSYQRFLATYKQCIVKIIEQGYSNDFEAGDSQTEMQNLWQEIYQMCLNILSSSINLIYADTKDIIKNLESSMKQVENEKQAENCSISLNFLSMPENSKKLLQSDNSEELEMIKKVYEQCCSIKRHDVVRIIETNTIGNLIA